MLIIEFLHISSGQNKDKQMGVSIKGSEKTAQICKNLISSHTK